MEESKIRTIEDWKTTWICSACGRENGVSIDVCPGCGLQQKLSYQLGIQKGIVSPEEAIFFEQRQLEKEKQEKENEEKKQREEYQREKVREAEEQKIEQRINKDLQSKAAAVFVFNLLALILFPNLISRISGGHDDAGDSLGTAMILYFVLGVIVLICVCVAVNIIKTGKGGKGLAIAALVLGIIAIFIYVKEISALDKLKEAYDSFSSYTGY